MEHKTKEQIAREAAEQIQAGVLRSFTGCKLPDNWKELSDHDVKFYADRILSALDQLQQQTTKQGGELAAIPESERPAFNQTLSEVETALRSSGVMGSVCLPRPTTSHILRLLRLLALSPTPLHPTMEGGELEVAVLALLARIKLANKGVAETVELIGLCHAVEDALSPRPTPAEGEQADEAIASKVAADTAEKWRPTTQSGLESILFTAITEAFKLRGPRFTGRPTEQQGERQTRADEEEINEWGNNHNIILSPPELRDAYEDAATGVFARAQLQTVQGARIIKVLDNLLHGYRDYCKRYDIHPQKCAEDAQDLLAALLTPPPQADHKGGES